MRRLQVCARLLFLGRQNSARGGVIPPSLLLCLTDRLTCGWLASELYVCKLLLQYYVLVSQLFILFFEAFSYVLQRNISLDFALLVELNASLKFRELGLLPFPEGALSRSTNMGNIMRISFRRERQEFIDLFWMRRPFMSIYSYINNKSQRFPPKKKYLNIVLWKNWWVFLRFATWLRLRLNYPFLRSWWHIGFVSTENQRCNNAEFTCCPQCRRRRCVHTTHGYKEN